MNMFKGSATSSVLLAVAIIVLAPFLVSGAMSNKISGNCRSCHDLMGTPHLASVTPHADFNCQECHRHSLSRRFHGRGVTIENLKSEISTLAVDEIRLNEEQWFLVNKKCAECHEAQYKDWQTSKHSLTYADSFLNSAHNKMEQPMNDCLRCHAMFFDGSIEDMVTPQNNIGPWKLKTSKLAKRNSVLCVSCHQVHPAEPPPKALPRYAALQISEPQTNSVFTGFYDRREKTFFPLSKLPHPKVNDGKNDVKISADARMRNCYQCHASSAIHKVGTSDDKTPLGVHAGLSCFDCHDTHRLSANNSCNKCHPKVSNCKLDVIQMNTTFKNRSSQHNIHTVACKDCHPNKNFKSKL